MARLTDAEKKKLVDLIEKGSRYRWFTRANFSLQRRERSFRQRRNTGWYAKAEEGDEDIPDFMSDKGLR